MTGNLTEKQKEVCDLVVLGLSSKEISARIGISPRTVEAHRGEVYRKYGVRNAVELVRTLLASKGTESHA